MPNTNLWDKKYLQSPRGEDVAIEGANVVSLSENGTRKDCIAVVIPESRRFEWLNDVDDTLRERAKEERQVFANWAAAARNEVLQRTVPLSADRRSEKGWWEYPEYDEPAMRRVLEKSQNIKEMTGSQVLDIGGTVKDSWRFVWHGGAASVDQVEVSPESQDLALARLNKLFEETPSLIEKFTFHTTPAEKLPFADESFDLAFSRSTIHHTRRPAVFKEVARVLRVGGLFMMMEPRLPRAIYALMVGFRRLRKVNRGTDDPLRNYELKQLDSILPIECMEASRLIQPYLRFLFPEIEQKLRNKIVTIDNALCATSFGQSLGHYVVVVARKN